MKKDILQLEANFQKIHLTSKSVLYKTENFIRQTKYIANLDFFVSKLCETILLNLKQILENESQQQSLVDCFLLQTSDKNFSFLFKLGYQIGNTVGKNDVILFDCLVDTKSVRQNDQRLNDYLKLHSKTNIIIKKTKKLTKECDFNKLYIISNHSGINLPKLSGEQKQIVETTDKNVLVQGVAGSGKTNICIDKIIFSACKSYGGKILYTTYSRGLLMDTKLKVQAYKTELENFLKDYKNKNVIFLDSDHKKSLENKFGLYFFSEDDDKIIDKISGVVEFLNTKVDYFLIQDIYKNHFGDAEFVSENYFVNTYSKSISNHQLARAFDKLQKYSKEIVFKEIYGMILGFYDPNNPQEILPLNQYIELRKNSFSKQECEILYQIALDYKLHCQKNNLVDNNLASKRLIDIIGKNSQYSLAIVDEVQDYSQVNLCLLKQLSIKMFCVGDALQMINPSYFSFGYLKNLLFDKDITSVSELKHNYRNTKKIEQIIDSLSQINKVEFGTHNFVISGESIDGGLKTTAVYVKSNDFASQIAKTGFDNFTFVVSSAKQKSELKKIIKNQEVLTVSEIKGLERNTIVAYNLLSDHQDKWQTLQQNKINHKSADENSVYRYYYNLFYVGLSRAKQNIFVVEHNNISQFESFFKHNFDVMNTQNAINKLSDIVSKIEFTQTEILERVAEFVKLGQYDNARFTANKINDDVKRISELRKMEISENFLQHGKYREAGIRFWEFGMIEDAKKQFTLSGDSKLIELVDACSKNSDDGLNIDIVNYFNDVKDNKLAQKFIIETVQKDILNLKSSFKNIKQNLKRSVGKNGK